MSFFHKLLYTIENSNKKLQVNSEGFSPAVLCIQPTELSLFPDVVTGAPHRFIPNKKYRAIKHGTDLYSSIEYATTSVLYSLVRMLKLLYYFRKVKVPLFLT